LFKRGKPVFLLDIKYRGFLSKNIIVTRAVYRRRLVNIINDVFIIDNKEEGKIASKCPISR
jgi:hypothetical protein